MKGKPMKKEKKNQWRTARRILSANMPIMALFVIIYKLLYSFVVQPAGQLIWGLALRFSPVSYITNSNIMKLFTSPLILAAVVLIALGLALWTFFNIAGIVICVQYGYENRPLRLSQLFRESLACTLRTLKPGNLPILIFSVLIIPATHFIMTTNFISQIVIPQYIAEVIYGNPLFRILLYALTAFGIFLTVQFMFIFQYFITEKCSFREAAAKSVRLIRGHRIRDFLLLVWWNLRLYIIYALLSLLVIAILFFAIIFMSGRGAGMVAGGTLTLKYVVVPLLLFVMECVETFAKYIFISILYYRHISEGSEARETDASAEEESAAAQASSAEIHKVRLGARLFMPVVLSAVLIVGLGFSWLMGSLIESDYGRGFLDFLIENEPEITCHRGYSAMAPENTLPAFQAAIDCKSQYAELDVQQTSDGVVVVTHDTNLKRCTGANVNIYDITWDELQKLDAGSYFSPEFAGTRIPSLDQVIKLCQGKIKLNIEIKNNGHSPSLEADTVRIIRENGFEDQGVITSLSYDSLTKVKEIAPELKTGYILAVGAGNYYDLPAADFFSVETTFVTQSMVDAIHMRGKEVHVWTVDRESDADNMISLEVDNIITGKPDMVREQIHLDRDMILDILTAENSWEDLSRYFSENAYSTLSQIYQPQEEEPEVSDLEDLLNEA